MQTVLWIKKYRQQIFALQLLLSLIFGPAMFPHNFFTMAAGFVLFLIVTSGALLLTTIGYSKAALAKSERVHQKVQAAHSKIKKDYTEITGERLDNYKPPAKKKQRKKKAKKTHRK